MRATATYSPPTRETLDLDQRPESVALIDALIAQAEGRFVFLSFLVEQLRGGREASDAIGGLGKGREMYDRFIDGVEARYGPKRADALFAVLGCLAAAEQAHGWIFDKGAVHDPATDGLLEPMARNWPGLSLELLAKVTHMDEPPAGSRLGLRVAFVEALILLQGVLFVGRGELGGSRYRLGLKEFATSMTSRRPREVERAFKGLADAALDAVEDIDQAPSREQVDVADERTLRELFPLLLASVKLAGDESLSERFSRLPVVDVSFRVEFETKAAGSRQRITWCDALLAAIRRGAGRPTDTLDRGNRLADVYRNRGVFKGDAPGYGPAAALVDFDRAVELMEALRNALGSAWLDGWRHDLAKAYMSRGCAKIDTHGVGPHAALVDCDRAVELMEALRNALGSAWPDDWRNDLANAYMNRGVIKGAAPGYGPTAALVDYDRAIALMEVLRNALGSAWPERK